jgi:hypothetical protein
MSSLLKSGLFKAIENDLLEMDGRIVFNKGQFCGGDSRCYGIFSFDSKQRPVLKVATGKKNEEEWFGILIHEYCHFLQWRDDCKVWQEFYNADFSFTSIIHNPDKYKKEILTLIRLELDCEKRTYNIINKSKLIDKKNYAVIANAVLYKYGYLYKYKKWPNNTVELHDVIKYLPCRILKSYKDYLNLPKEIVKLFS